MPLMTQRREDRDRATSFAETLEKRAWQVAATSSQLDDDLLPSALIKDQIALCLDQIDQQRAREQQITQQLRQAECDIDTELMQMEQRTPRYSPYRFPEREKLQRRLARIGEEQRRLSMAHADRLDTLHDRMLSLQGKHRQLKTE